MKEPLMKKLRNKRQKTNSKMEEINPTLSIVALNTDKKIKRQKYVFK
jgi:hypothetical protein